MSNTLNGSLTPRNVLTGRLLAGGGGGGTTDYNDLTNKPQINNVTLSGNKTSSDLGLFSGDYPELDNKPQINNVTLSGNKTSSDLGLFSGDYDDLTNKPIIPQKLTELEDVNISATKTGWLVRIAEFVPGSQPTNYYIDCMSPSLNSILDVNISNATSGDLLTYTGTTWTNEKLYTDYIETLTSGNTTITILNASITGDETIDVYTDVFGVNPTNIVATSGSIVLTFPVQASNVSVKVRLS